MEWLTLWLKKIILLVLLAAFLDLILPNTNLQRYVKMVMGLIILMTILSPVFQIFNLSQDELAMKINRYQQEIAEKTPDTEWKAIAERLAGEKDQEVTRYVTSQMETMIQHEIESAYQVSVTSVRVQLAANSNDKPKIQTITVDIDKTRKPEEKQIAKIDPIKVQITPQDDSGKDQALPVSGRQDDILSRQIASKIAQDWSVQLHQVHVNHNDTKEPVAKEG